MKNKNTSQIQTYEKLQGLGPASDSSYKCYNTTQPARGSERGKSIWIARFDLYSKIWFPLSTTAVGCAYFFLPVASAVACMMAGPERVRVRPTDTAKRARSRRLISLSFSIG
jgi:hypothetical protein